MSEHRFEAIVESRPRGSIAVRLPFDPDAIWGEKDRHYVTGSIQNHPLRGTLTVNAGAHYLQLGPAWCRFRPPRPGDRVTVVLEPEGPQPGTMDPEFSAALAAEPDARRFFESLATFYRNGFVRGIEKREATGDAGKTDRGGRLRPEGPTPRAMNCRCLAANELDPKPTESWAEWTARRVAEDL